jgi:hypothetical protein
VTVTQIDSVWKLPFWTVVIIPVELEIYMDWPEKLMFAYEVYKLYVRTQLGEFVVLA